MLPQAAAPPDQWSLSYLVSSVEQNQDLSTLINGLPSEEFQLKQRHEQPLSSTVGSIFSQLPIVIENPQFALPQTHYTAPPPARPTPTNLAEYTEDQLFYLIYGPQYEPTTQSSLRYLALKEMGTRGWTYLENFSATTASPGQVSPIWALDCTTESIFNEYLYLDIPGGNTYRNKVIPTPSSTKSAATKSLSTDSGNKIFITFNPTKWHFSFQLLILNKYKTVGLDELLN